MGRLKGWQWECHLKGCQPRGKRKGGEGRNNKADSGWKLFLNNLLLENQGFGYKGPHYS